MHDTLCAMLSVPREEIIAPRKREVHLQLIQNHDAARSWDDTASYERNLKPVKQQPGYIAVRVKLVEEGSNNGILLCDTCGQKMDARASEQRTDRQRC